MTMAMAITITMKNWKCILAHQYLIVFWFTEYFKSMTLSHGKLLLPTSINSSLLRFVKIKIYAILSFFLFFVSRLFEIIHINDGGTKTCFLKHSSPSEFSINLLNLHKGAWKIIFTSIFIIIALQELELWGCFLYRTRKTSFLYYDQFRGSMFPVAVWDFCHNYLTKKKITGKAQNGCSELAVRDLERRSKLVSSLLILWELPYFSSP